MAKEHYPEIDVFKGVLIVLVVVGHLIPQFVADVTWGGLRAVFFAIYGFHMQAFAFIAGFCAQRLLEDTNVSSRGEFIRRRAERLIVPYLIWGVLYFVARMIVPSLSVEGYEIARSWQFVIGYNPDGALWFLWTLFVATVLVVVGLRFVSLGLMVIVSTSLAVLALWTQPWLTCPISINALPLFVAFFALGLFVRQRYTRVRRMVVDPCFGIVVLSVWGLVQSCHPLSLDGVPWYMLGLSSLLGTAALLFVSIRIADFSCRLKNTFAFLSAHAMEIFILAEPVKVVARFVFRRIGMPLPLSFAIMMSLMLLVPVFVARYVLRDRRLGLLLLGKR